MYINSNDERELSKKEIPLKDSVGVIKGLKKTYVLNLGKNSNGNTIEVYSNENGMDWSKLSELNIGQTFNRRIIFCGFKNYLWIGFAKDYSEFGELWSSQDGRKWNCVKKITPFVIGENTRMFANDGRIFILGGRSDDESGDNSYSIKDVWYSDDGDKWEKSPSLLNAENDVSIISNAGKNYIFDSYEGKIWTIKDGRKLEGYQIEGYVKTEIQHLKMTVNGNDLYLWIFNKKYDQENNEEKHNDFYYQFKLP